MRDIGYYIKKVRDLPPRVVMQKALMKPIAFTARKLEKVRARLSTVHVSGKQLLESLNGFMNLQEVLDHIRGERPKFFIDRSIRGELVSLIQRELPQLRDEIVTEADKVCSHVFDLLGSGDVNLDEFVEKHGGKEKYGYLPWHFDFKTGCRWNTKRFYKEIKIPYGKADIKVPWELSRFQHVAALGQAYWLTGDEKDAEEFVKQVDDWIDRNPVKFGVNWGCTMDVAIRVANWLWGYYFFRDSKALTDEFMLKFLKSLLAHGRFIMKNLENMDITSNHYLSDLVGLIYLGIAFPEFKEAKHWREFGIQELTKEMEKQVYDDGMDFEASTCYHRLALELFFYPALLCRLNNTELPDSFIEKLKKMFDFVLYVLKPNGRMPQIGDNDNGRLHVLGKRDILDMSYLLTFATLFSDDPKYKIEEFGFAPEALWVFGPVAHQRWHKMPARSVEELESKAFPDGGIYVMRHKKDYMVISCGPNGQNGNGGHAHNDKLSFELCVDGEDIIVDPGTYVYTTDPKCRNKFRSTAYHNTIMIGGAEQNRFGSMFKLCNDSNPRCLEWHCSDKIETFIGEHRGYARLVPPLVHRREVDLDKGRKTWVIKDSFLAVERGKRSMKNHSYKWSLYLAPNIQVRQDREGLILSVPKSTLRPLRVEIRAEGTQFEFLDVWYSPRYGVKVESKAIIWSTKKSIPYAASIYIRPVKSWEN